MISGHCKQISNIYFVHIRFVLCQAMALENCLPTFVAATDGRNIMEIGFGQKSRAWRLKCGIWYKWWMRVNPRSWFTLIPDTAAPAPAKPANSNKCQFGQCTIGPGQKYFKVTNFHKLSLGTPGVMGFVVGGTSRGNVNPRPGSWQLLCMGRSIIEINTIFVHTEIGQICQLVHLRWIRYGRVFINPH